MTLPRQNHILGIIIIFLFFFVFYPLLYFNRLNQIENDDSIHSIYHYNLILNNNSLKSELVELENQIVEIEALLSTTPYQRKLILDNYSPNILFIILHSFVVASTLNFFFGTRRRRKRVGFNDNK